MFTAGCVTATAPSRVPALLAHPEFPTAAQMAPNFTEAALKAVADAEADAARARISR